MRRTTMAAAATTALLLTSACSGSDGEEADPDNPVTIDITVTNATETYTVPWLVGMDQGFFADRGVEIGELVPGQGGSTTLRNLISGDLAVADVSYPAVVQAAGDGNPITVVGGAFQSLYGLDFYAMADNAAVQSIEDVRTWAFTNAGSVTESLTYLIPEEAGLGSTEVERVAAGGIGEGIALLESGDVDVAIVPDSVRAQNPDTFRLVVSSSEYLDIFQQTVITGTQEYVQENPAVIEAVLAGYQESADWIADNVEEAGALYAEYADLPADVAVAAVQGALDQESWSAGVQTEALTSAAEAMEVTGYEGEFPYCDLFDPQFLPDGAEMALPEDC